MKKTNQILMITLFFVFLVFISIANLFTTPRAFSENENRVLEQFPDFTMKKMLFEDYTSDLETWFTDQFIWRDSWIVLKAIGEQAVGKIENKGVYFGQDGQLIAQFDLLDQQRLQKNISLVQSFSEKVTVPISFMIVPTVAEINKQQLPTLAYNTNQSDLLEMIQDQIKDTSLSWVDVYTPLVQASTQAKQTVPLYFKTDHHWTAYGAYIGYQTYMETLGRQALVAREDLHYSVVSTNFKGTQYSKSGAFWLPGENIVTWENEQPINVEIEYDQTKEIHNSLFSMKRLAQKDQYTLYLDGNHARVDIQSDAQNQEKLLIIKDSYAHVLTPYLATHFSDIIMVDLRYYRAPLSQLIENEGVDRVLILYSLDNFSHDGNLGLLK